MLRKALKAAAAGLVILICLGLAVYVATGPERPRAETASAAWLESGAYQVGRAKRYDAKLGLASKTDYCKTDFCNMPFGDNEHDGAYAIEATCHATDKVKCYSEVFRVLKPGAAFADLEDGASSSGEEGEEV